MEIKRNIPLIIGIAIPIAMILFVAASIYLPRSWEKPQYDFLYASGSYYPVYYERNADSYIEHRFSVRGGRFVEEKLPPVAGREYYRDVEQRPKFYRYHVETNTNTELSFEEAQKLVLDENKKSPDGFEVTHGSSGGGVFPFIFWSERDYDKAFLKGDYTSHAISVNSHSAYDMFFIGWVTQ